MKYGNIYKVLIMAVLAAIILSLSMRLFKNPEESKEPIVQPETAAELTEEDITAETERNQTTMATYPDEVEAEGGEYAARNIFAVGGRGLYSMLLYKYRKHN